ncbi:Fasciculation and elongation protein zeta-1 [Tupaia chinensis]|uniref:Fasciculation and elongation protein zeta-1 n=1 Tax=Tupaia chinensis TaxID=246437 RepID=L9LC10_TUPCH|nr:Fasciculation and elongation protein zeta-1 [Tupaia chinensis]
MEAPLVSLDEEFEDLRPSCSEEPDGGPQCLYGSSPHHLEDPSLSELENFSSEIISFKSMEDLVNEFDEKLTVCFRNYNAKTENLAPVRNQLQIQEEEETLQDEEVWDALTDNYIPSLSEDWRDPNLEALNGNSSDAEVPLRVHPGGARSNVEPWGDTRSPVFLRRLWGEHGSDHAGRVGVGVRALCAQRLDVRWPSVPGPVPGTPRRSEHNTPDKVTQGRAGGWPSGHAVPSGHGGPSEAAFRLRRMVPSRGDCREQALAEPSGSCSLDGLRGHGTPAADLHVGERTGPSQSQDLLATCRQAGSEAHVHEKDEEEFNEKSEHDSGINEEPLLTADQVIEEIEEMMQDSPDPEEEEGVLEEEDGGETSSQADSVLLQEMQALTRTFNKWSYEGLRHMSGAELAELLDQVEGAIRAFSEELVQQQARRDELEFEKEVRNSFITALLEVQSKQREQRGLLKRQRREKGLSLQSGRAERASQMPLKRFSMEGLSSILQSGIRQTFSSSGTDKQVWTAPQFLQGPPQSRLLAPQNDPGIEYLHTVIPYEKKATPPSVEDLQMLTNRAPDQAAQPLQATEGTGLRPGRAAAGPGANGAHVFLLLTVESGSRNWLFLFAMKEDNEKVPTLLTDYILKDALTGSLAVVGPQRQALVWVTRSLAVQHRGKTLGFPAGAAVWTVQGSPASPTLQLSRDG